jgi:hypothetical protein
VQFCDEILRDLILYHLVAHQKTTVSNYSAHCVLQSNIF